MRDGLGTAERVGRGRTGSSDGAWDRSETSVCEREVKRVLDVGSERNGTSERTLMSTGSCEKGSEVLVGADDAGVGDARGDF